MKRLFIIILILFLSSGLFAEDITFSLKQKPTKNEKGMLVGMTIIVVSIAAPVLYEGYRIASK